VFSFLYAFHKNLLLDFETSLYYHLSRDRRCLKNFCQFFIYFDVLKLSKWFVWQFPVIVKDDNMTCIFHFLANFAIFGGKTKNKVIMSFRISFDRYMILILPFPSILYNFEKEINNCEIFKILKWMKNWKNLFYFTSFNFYVIK